MLESICRALNKIEQEINECNDLHSVFKLYRQARIWNRYQCSYAEAIDVDMYHEINEKLKAIRNNAKYRLKKENENALSKSTR